VETCTYGDLPDDGQPHTTMTSATISGTSGTPYRVTLHIRGVTGETRVMGGVAGDPTTFFTGGTRYADGTKAPLGS
jgi:hypothetical protein